MDTETEAEAGGIFAHPSPSASPEVLASSSTAVVPSNELGPSGPSGVGAPAPWQVLAEQGRSAACLQGAHRVDYSNNRVISTCRVLCGSPCYFYFRFLL